MSSFHFVDFDEPGVKGKGKGSPNIQIRICNVMRNLGVDRTGVLPYDELMAAPAPTAGTKNFALLHYNELHLVKSGKADWLQAREDALSERGYSVLHPVEAGLTVGVKRRQNQVLRAAGVPMPRRVTTGDTFERVFSNAETAAHVAVQVKDAGTTLNEERYNTDYVDTVHEFDGIPYYVSLRAQAVGTTSVFSWVRARPVSDGDPSVHTRNTPVDAALITHLHERLITPNRDQIEEICRGIGTALGPGLYCHDILPEAGRGKFWVCETNFKFYDGNHRFHMNSISKEHPVPALFDARRAARSIARALYSELNYAA